MEGTSKVMTAVAGFAALLALSSAFAQPQSGGGRGGDQGFAPPRANRPPVIRTSLAGETAIDAGRATLAHSLRFTVDALDPDGDAVTLRLLNPPPGVVFRPALGEPSPVRREVRWAKWGYRSEGVHPLLFEAHDARWPERRVRKVVRLRVEDSCFRSDVGTADVTGDGVQDVLQVVSRADVEGVEGAGAIHLWDAARGAAGLPTASLVVPGAKRDDYLASDGYSAGFLETDDVTGDGVADVVAWAPRADRRGIPDVGAIYVWAGSPDLAGRVAPTAALLTLGGRRYDRLGGVRLADVTGDGMLDVVASALADVDGVVDTGALYVWAGGSDLQGTVRPRALVVPGAAENDRLTSFQLADVTGDGGIDVVAHAPLADAGGVADVGAIHVWAGGPGLAGSGSPSTVPPDVTLAIADPSQGDSLASGGLHLVELTGDGFLDLAAVTPGLDRHGMADAGAVLVWAGGPALTDGGEPIARLVVPEGAPLGSLGACEGSCPCVAFADTSGDGTPEVFVRDADRYREQGFTYVWEGGAALRGDVDPVAVLAVGRQPVGVEVFEDVTGDGIVDALGGGCWSGIRVWEGGASFRSGASGAIRAGDTGGLPRQAAALELPPKLQPSATLVVPEVPDEDLWLMRIVDANGDGVLDVLAGSSRGTVDGVTEAGALYLWPGGPGMRGVRAYRVRLAVTDLAGYPWLALGLNLGLVGPYYPHNVVRIAAFELGDVTGDGRVDAVVAASRAEIGGVGEAGAVFVWEGFGSLEGAPPTSARLRIPSASYGDLLGYANASEGLQLWDANDDGVLDVVTTASRATIAGAYRAGGVFVWNGGAGLVGVPVPDAVLSSGNEYDDLGSRGDYGFGEGALPADVSGDGALDLVAASVAYQACGMSDTSATYLWRGPMNSSDPPWATLLVPLVLP